MNIWLFLGLIVFIILINKNRIKDTFSQDSLYNDPKWDSYRLGDCINGWGPNTSYHSEKYPGSLASMYLKLNTVPRKNYKKFSEVIKQWIKNNNWSQESDRVALHLRVGDVIENPEKKHGFSHGRDYWKPLEYYSTVEIPTKKVTIYAGIHRHGIKEDKSMKYVTDVGNILKKRGIGVEYKLGGSPDEDFVSMVTAPQFIKGGGGFSNLVSTMRKYM